MPLSPCQPRQPCPGLGWQHAEQLEKTGLRTPTTLPWASNADWGNVRHLTGTLLLR